MLPRCVFALALFGNLVLFVIKVVQMLFCERSEVWYVITVCITVLAAANVSSHACLVILHGQVKDNNMHIYFVFKVLAVAMLLAEVVNTCLTYRTPCWTSLAEVVSFSACVFGSWVLCRSQWNQILIFTQRSCCCRNCFPASIPSANPDRASDASVDLPTIIVTQH